MNLNNCAESQRKLIIQKIKNNKILKFNKDLFFNNFNEYYNKNRASVNIISNEKKGVLGRNALLLEYTKFFLEKYKLTDKNKYSPINLNIKNDLNDKVNNNNHNKKHIIQKKKKK